MTSTPRQHNRKHERLTRSDVNPNLTRHGSKIHQFFPTDSVVSEIAKVAAKERDICRTSQATRRDTIGFQIMRSPEFRTCLLWRADVKQMEHSLSRSKRTAARLFYDNTCVTPRKTRRDPSTIIGSARSYFGVVCRHGARLIIY